MHSVTCTCGETFEARHPRARYCSDRCRKRGQRAPAAAVVSLPVEAPSDGLGMGPIEIATAAELIAADRHETALGLVVIALARRLDRGERETGSSYTALSKEFEAKRAVALKGAGVQTAPGALEDELAARRAKLA